MISTSSRGILRIIEDVGHGESEFTKRVEEAIDGDVEI